MNSTCIYNIIGGGWSALVTKAYLSVFESIASTCYKNIQNLKCLLCGDVP